MDIYELFGFAAGDGYIYYNPKRRKYKLELTGNVDEDYDYFFQIEDFLKSISDRTVFLTIQYQRKGRCIRLNIYDKKLVDYLVRLGLPKGKKTFIVNFPKSVSGRQETSLLRGLFEADGCLYFSKSRKGKYPTYPRLEIKTSSYDLFNRLKQILKKKGFAPYIRNPSGGSKTFAIGVSGEIALQRWRKVIGFVSLKNKTKYGFWKTKGFYIPRTPLKSRLKYAHVA